MSIARDVVSDSVSGGSKASKILGGIKSGLGAGWRAAKTAGGAVVGAGWQAGCQGVSGTVSATKKLRQKAILEPSSSMAQSVGEVVGSFMMGTSNTTNEASHVKKAIAEAAQQKPRLLPSFSESSMTSQEQQLGG